MNRLSISLLALLAATPSLAQTTDTELDEIVVTANRTETEAARTGVSVTVVEKEDLAKAGDESLASVLGRLPGVSVTTLGPVGSTSNLRIRGADRRYIAVFIDGIRVTDPTQTETAFDFGSLLAADVARVEVLRGSQSALWGGSAVGGVINITTHERLAEDGRKQTVLAEYGSDNTALLSYGLTQKQGRLETAFSATHFRTDGFSTFVSGTEEDGSEASRLSFSARYAMTDALAIGGALFTQESFVEFDGAPPPNFVLIDQPNSETKNEYGGRIFAEIEGARTKHVLDLTGYSVTRKVRDLGQGDSTFTGDRLSLGWNATTEVSGSLSFVYGIDAMREGAEYNRLPTGTRDTSTKGAFAQALWAPMEGLDLSATLRGDDHSEFGRFSTGRLAASWNVMPGTVLRASVGTGFRAPSIDELYGDYGFFVGNPALTPEESTSYDLGVDHEFASGAALSLSLFRLETDNLITYAPSVFPAPDSLENLAGTSVRKGVEVSVDVPLSDAVSLAAAYTYTDAKRPDGRQLSFVPTHKLDITMDTEFGNGWSGSFGINHSSGAVDGGVELGGYTVYRAQVARDIGDDRELFLRVENLTDKQYQVVRNYATPDRSIHAGIRASF